MKVHGDVTLVATRDIGSLGPMEGKPVTYRWNRVWSVLGYLSYAVMGSFILYMLWRSRRPVPMRRAIAKATSTTREAVR